MNALELNLLIDRFEYVAKEICHKEATIQFASQDERDKIIANLEKRQRHYTIAEYHLTEVGWPVADWVRLLKSRRPDLLPSDGPSGKWENLEASEATDLLINNIVAESNEILPHVDTTVFVEFGQMMSTHEFHEDLADLCGYSVVIKEPQFLDVEHPHWCDREDDEKFCNESKLRLHQIFERAMPVCGRIRILTSTTAKPDGRRAQRVEYDFEYRECGYLDIKIGLSTIVRPNSKEVELTRSQRKLVCALIQAGDSGVHFKDLLPKVAQKTKSGFVST